MSHHYVLGTVNGQRVAIEAEAVESVIDITETTPVPLVPPSVIGLCAVRSRVLTVIDVATVVGAAYDDPKFRAASVIVDGHRYALRMARIDDAIMAPEAPAPIDASIGANWQNISTGRIDTGAGFALVLSPEKIIERAACTD
jgi:purine-binding chemotaxis protein CheW